MRSLDVICPMHCLTSLKLWQSRNIIQAPLVQLASTYYLFSAQTYSMNLKFVPVVIVLAPRVISFLCNISPSIAGLVDYLQTEVSTSKQKKFPLVTFVDTPGLVDGDMIYPFDVNRALLWLGDLVDLIFVFFDPIGQVGFNPISSTLTMLSRACF